MTLTLSFKYKVLSELVHDKDSAFHKLKAPNNVAKDVLPVVWRFLASNWQVVLTLNPSAFSSIFMINFMTDIMCGW